MQLCQTVYIKLVLLLVIAILNISLGWWCFFIGLTSPC